MPATQTLDRVIDGAREGSGAFLDIFRSGNERMYRINRIVLDEVQRTQDETLDLARTWLTAPTDISAFNNELVQTLTRRVRRRMELGRTLVDDIRDMGADGRSIFERVSEANRETTQATATAGRRAASRVAEEASAIVERASEATDKAVDQVSETLDDAAKDLRRQSRRNNTNN